MNFGKIISYIRSDCDEVYDVGSACRSQPERPVSSAPEHATERADETGDIPGQRLLEMRAITLAAAPAKAPCRSLMPIAKQERPWVSKGARTMVWVCGRQAEPTLPSSTYCPVRVTFQMMPVSGGQSYLALSRTMRTGLIITAP